MLVEISMEKNKAIEYIKKTLELSEIELDDISITMETDLLEDGILDSLDAMTFLFNLEKNVNTQIVEIDDDFNDFKISSLVSILLNY